MSETPIAKAPKLDLLNRKEFIDRFIHIADVLARNKKSVCYAINGRWGVGKTFVLDMIEKHQSLSEYWIFRYNCWEHDYYDEPLMAIVATMLERIDKETRIVPKGIRTRLVEIGKIVAGGILRKSGAFFEERTGINVNELASTVVEGFHNADQALAKTREFDQYYPLKQALELFRKQVVELTESYPVLFVVDELDRCLPEYAIKVLERLHHMFHDIPNVQIVISIDKRQLEHTVRQIFGDATDVNRYLAKFISFELQLPEGSFCDIELFEIRFREYLSKFTYANRSTVEYDVIDFKCNVFDGIDMRNRIAIIDKCLLLHEMLTEEDQPVDYAYMCMEVLLAIIKHAHIDIEAEKQSFTISRLFNQSESTQVLGGLQYVAQKYQNHSSEDPYYHYEQSKHYVYPKDIWGILLAGYRAVLGGKNDCISHHTFDIATFRAHAVDFWNLLQSLC